ncbi:sialate O-acetylesterase [Chryseobacterium lathyri]|uniref:sialate O-acetylesterase n=1 Tax=Chryseobacterium lathyri TaxID=395933 RepID=UPI001CBFE07D|nr:sialate O-acetylesterase [Chryseobacterium lathyri]
MPDIPFIKLEPISNVPETSDSFDSWIVVDKGDGELGRMPVELFYQIIGNIAKPISPADPAPTVEGWYKPQTSSDDPGTNYPNAGNLKARKGYDTLFWYDGANWRKTEVELPGVEVASIFDPLNGEDAQGAKQITDWLYGSETTEFGSTTALTRADMNTFGSSNSVVVYWLTSYTVPYANCILSEFQMNVVNPADIYIKRYKKSGTGPNFTLTFQDEKIYTLSAGLNTINILTTPDKGGNINNSWKWNSDDVIALFCTGGLKYSTNASPFNGLYGYATVLGNTSANFTISQLTFAAGGILMSLKFIELISVAGDGQVVPEIKVENEELIPNVKAVMDYIGNSGIKKLTDIILVPSFGQSLAGGTDGGTSTFPSTTAVPEAFNINGANHIVQDMNGGYVETFIEMAKQNNYALPTGFMFMTSVSFLGGTCITDLSKGTTTYNSLLSQVQTAKNTAASLGKTFSVPAFCWTQGEEDYRAGDNAGDYGSGKYIPTEYASKLIKLIDDLNTDIKAITGQKNDVKCIMYQVASHNPYTRYPRIAIEQLNAAIKDKRIFLAKTMYDVEYNAADNVHAPNKTYRNMGNHYGIALFDAIVKNEHRLPIYPVKNTRVGNSMYIQFHVPVKPLMFDDVWVTPQTDGNKGFNLVNVNNEYSTTATIASSATMITAVNIVSADTVKIDFSGPPAAGTRLTYGVNGSGWNIINGSRTGTRKSGRTEGARGNLRDSQTFFNPVMNYFNLYNWGPIFEIIL